MLSEVPIGTVKLSLQGPVVDYCSPGPKDPTCKYDFVSTDKLDYCSTLCDGGTEGPRWCGHVFWIYRRSF